MFINIPLCNVESFNIYCPKMRETLQVAVLRNEKHIFSCCLSSKFASWFLKLTADFIMSALITVKCFCK